MLIFNGLQGHKKAKNKRFAWNYYEIFTNQKLQKIINFAYFYKIIIK